MELGKIRLGRMGTSMVRRLQRAGHHCVVYDLQPEAVQALIQGGAVGATSLEDLSQKLLSALRFQFGGHEEKSAAPKGGV